MVAIADGRAAAAAGEHVAVVPGVAATVGAVVAGAAVGAVAVATAAVVVGEVVVLALSDAALQLQPGVPAVADAPAAVGAPGPADVLVVAVAPAAAAIRAAGRANSA